MSDVRNAAIELLHKIDVNEAYSTLSVADELKNSTLTDKRDRALFTTIVYGVIERKITLDYNLSLYLSQPIKKLHPKVLTILRVGLYQIFYMDKIPVGAAVNESVKSAKKQKCAYAGGIINAVLRKAASKGLVLPDKSDLSYYFSIKYSFPAELTEHYIKYYGIENAEKIMMSAQGRRPVYIRVNKILTSQQQLITMLQKENVEVKNTSLENCLEISGFGDITQLESFKLGYFHVQDMSSQLCCSFLQATENDILVDCCAAPGGKTFTLAQHMNGKGKVIACDPYEHKTNLIEEGAKRLNIECVKTVCCDARELPDKVADADKVLCDVPCSGFGVVGRKPEIRYKKLSDLAELPELQYDILNKCSAMVKKAGVLVYSTCTLNPAENEAVCDRFIKEHTNFCIADDEHYLSYTEGGKYITFIPGADSGDGFFVAKFIRKA